MVILRLEQGRDHHPSPQVLDAIASVLQRSEKFAVTGADRQLMVIYHADPGTRSYEARQGLASQAGQTRSLRPN